MIKIQDYNFGYALLRRYVDFKVKTSFRNFVVRGKKNLPTNGAIIIGYQLLRNSHQIQPFV